jgi:predicted permease
MTRFRAQGESLSDIAAFANADVDATIDGSGEEITTQLVSGNFFQMLGVASVAGRMITAADDASSSEAVIVISRGFWQRRFALDPSAVGKQVVLNGNLIATIIGVAPPDFHMGRGLVPDFFIPLAFERQLAAGLLASENWGLGIVGRMRPGVRLDQVRDNLQGVFHDFALQEVPNTQPLDLPRLEVISAAQGFASEIVSDALRPNVTRYQLLEVLSLAVIVLLLIVGLNVANLLIARAATRQYEIGVRLAMGATRLRLIRQLLTESVVQAFMGGSLGVLLAYSGRDLLRLFLQNDSRMVLDLRIDPAVLAFSALLSLATGVFFGIAPALRATRMDVQSAVKQDSRTVRGSRAGIGRILLVIQVAMSVIFLVGASLLLRTVGNLPSTNIGFNPENMLSFRVNVEALRANRARYEQVIEAIRAVPDVAAVTTSSAAFLGTSGTYSNGRFDRSAQDPQPVRTGTVRIQTVRADFFETFAIPVSRGRAFDRRDVSSDPRIALVTESLARRLNSDPIGWRFQLGRQSSLAFYEIIGVVPNIGVSEIGRPLDGTVFILESEQDLLSSFEVRTSSSPLIAIASIRQALRRIDPDLRASQVLTQMELVRRKLEPTRYIAAAWIAFGGVALLLTSIGLYGLLSHGVARRTNEIGIRMALGARQVHVLRLVMAQILILVFVGLSLGLGLSLVINQLMRAFIYGVTFNDLRTFVMAAAIMLAVTIVASYLPARRATLVDPTVALRHE